MLPFEKSAMVWGITGPLGSGKSLVAVANIYKQFKIGSCFVCSNIQLNIPLISKELGVDISPFYMFIDLFKDDFDFTKLPQGSLRGRTQKKRVLVVLDEIAEFFDQYQSAKSRLLNNFLSWLRHSSKQGQDVLIICQNPQFVQKSLRLLIHRWVFCANLSQYKLPIVQFPLLPNFSVTKITDKYGSSVRGGTWIYYQPKWGRYYDTAQIISKTLDGDHVQFREYKTEFNFLSLLRFVLFFKFLALISILIF